MPSQLAFGNTAGIESGQENCSARIIMNKDEKLSLLKFSTKLERLRRYYGKPSFDSELAKILLNENPETRVLEVSSVYLEKMRNLVEQQHLKHSIAKLIGLKDPAWRNFDRMMKNITELGDPIKYFQRQRFADETLSLIQRIEKSGISNEVDMNSKQTQSSASSVEIARAVTQLANMYLYLEHWSLLNQQIRQYNVNKVMLVGLAVTAGGLLVASTIYAGSIVAAAGAIGASFSTDVVVAAQLARLGQVMAGATLGAVGAPTALLLKDTTTILFEAEKRSKNRNTLYACELENLIAEWRQKGFSPYLTASLVGGGLGLGGGMITLTKAGAQAVLYSTAFGVGVVELYAISAVSENTLYALREFRLAREAADQGKNEEAVYHLHRAREFTKDGKEAFLDALLVGVLAGAIAKDLPNALKKGESIIRAMYANSSDTLPQALEIGTEALKTALDKKSDEKNSDTFQMPKVYFPSGYPR